MLTKIKEAIETNLSRIVAGGLISLLTVIFAWAFAPIKEIIAIPSALKTIQSNMEQKQDAFILALKQQQKADSILFVEVKSLQCSNKLMQTEVGTLKSKLHAIKEEFPALHKRFNDIEQAVNNTNFAYQPILNIPNYD